MRNRTHFAGAALLVVALLVPAIADDTQPLGSGVDRSGFDESARPQDDFNRWVNGGWIDNTEIPADKIRWGSFNILREESDAHQREIIEELSERTDLTPGTEEQQIGDLYASLMDEEHINRLGMQPVAPYLDQIDDVTSLEGLTRLFGEFARIGVTRPIAQFVGVDSGDSQILMAAACYAGMGITAAKKSQVAGTFVCEYVNMGSNVPSIFQVPELINNLPPGMIGSEPVWANLGFDERSWSVD